MAFLHEHIDGKYEILGKLKEGGMGAIYKVRHRLLDEIRVVKVIRTQGQPTGDSSERFLQEARVAIRLRHPNIASLHDFAIADDGNAFIVMEYIDGLNLQEILHGNGPPPLSLTLETARQSLKALGYLHRQRIVHRDVSPDNLMLTRDQDGNVQVKLIDLGIAKAFGGGIGEGSGAGAGLTTTGIFLGKPRYASPEQFGTAALNARSDLYSFGVVLYELLTGRCPITGQDPASYMAGHLVRPPVSFEVTDPGGRVPAELRQAVMRALAKKPEERFESAEDFIWAVTLLQDRFPLIGRELEEVIEASLPALTRPVLLPPEKGSAQDKLDREFLVTGVPSLPPLPSPPPVAVTAVEMPIQARSAGQPASLPTLEAMPLRGRATVPPDPERTRRTREDSVLDATWLSVPRPAEVEAAQIPTEIVAREKSPRRDTLRPVLLAATIGLALVTAGLTWRLLSRPDASPAGKATPAPVTPPPAPSPIVTDVEPTAPPVQATPAPRPSPTPTPQKPPRREAVAPEDQVADVTVVDPMKLGDKILRGLPNVEVPALRDFPSYNYPAAARGSGLKVIINVQVLVDENGKVIDTKIRGREDGSGLGFNEAALEAARRASYFPPTRDGIAGKMWTDLNFEFVE